MRYNVRELPDSERLGGSWRTRRRGAQRRLARTKDEGRRGGEQRGAAHEEEAAAGARGPSSGRLRFYELSVRGRAECKGPRRRQEAGKRRQQTVNGGAVGSLGWRNQHRDGTLETLKRAPPPRAQLAHSEGKGHARHLESHCCCATVTGGIVRSNSCHCTGVITIHKFNHRLQNELTGDDIYSSIIDS